jgi:hypothetical protein
MGNLQRKTMTPTRHTKEQNWASKLGTIWKKSMEGNKYLRQKKKKKLERKFSSSLCKKEGFKTTPFLYSKQNNLLCIGMQRWTYD